MWWWLANPYVRDLVDRRAYKEQVAGVVLHHELSRMHSPIARRMMHLVKELVAVHGPVFSIRDVLRAARALAKIPGPEHADARRDCEILAALMVERANVYAIRMRRAAQRKHRAPLPFRPMREARAMALAYGYLR